MAWHTGCTLYSGLVIALLLSGTTLANGQVTLSKTYRDDAKYQIQIPTITVSTRKSCRVLAERTVNISTVANQKRTIIALNFHATSDFNSADLAVDNNGRLIVIEDLWSAIEKQAIRIHAVPDWPFDHVFFSVTRIEGQTLHCRFFGRSFKKRADAEVTFNVQVKMVHGREGIRFRVTRK